MVKAIGTERYRLSSSTYSRLPSFDERRSAKKLSFSTRSSPKFDNDKLSLVTSSTVSELRLPVLSVRSAPGGTVDRSTFAGGSGRIGRIYALDRNLISSITVWGE